jgi:hypothetical protein
MGGKIISGIRVSVAIKYKKIELWSWFEDTHGWQYTQIPLDFSEDFQVSLSFMLCGL